MTNRMENVEEYVLNPQIFTKKKKYIWFDRNEIFRKYILNIFKLFLFYEIYLDGFASDHSRDIVLKIFHKEIVDITVLDENEAIVVADTDVNYAVCCPVKVRILEGNAEFDTKNIYDDNAEGFYLKTGTYLRIYRITEMERLLCDKPVFVYGTSDEAARFAKYVRLLDFHFKGFYEDYETIRAEKLEEIDGYPVNCIEDFLYEENGMYMSSRQFYEEELYLQESFRDKLQSRKRENAYEFIYDLSSVFDDVHDVYMDICHVCEKGNKIIAGAIYDVIKNEIR